MILELLSIWYSMLSKQEKLDKSFKCVMFMQACAEGHMKAVELLLASSANINSRDRFV